MTQIFKGFRTYPTAQQAGCVLTLGNFDGVHRGHREILALALKRAGELGKPAVAYTFRPHPRVLLQPNLPMEFIATYDERLSLLSALGFDAIIEEPFSEEFSHLNAKEFFERVICDALDARTLVVGYDFGFGRFRGGQLEELRGLCIDHSVELCVVEALRDSEGKIISSSRIRALLHAGEVTEAARLLGRPFSYEGTVFHGDARGGQIGFPTANIRVPDAKLSLPFGVYVSRTSLERCEHASVTNIGVRPTFGSAGAAQGPIVETHLLDFTGDLYDRPLEVRFVQRLREERRMSGVEELKRQITADVKMAREALALTS